MRNLTGRFERSRRLFAAGLACSVLGMATGSDEARGVVDDPRLIAFELPSGIHVVHADGTGLRRLPGTQRGDQNPSWSPDGKKIAFWTDSRYEGEIYVADSDGSNRRLLTHDDPRSEYFPSDQYPTWSPDGSLIAFESYRSGDWHIWVTRADGTGARRLTPDGHGGYSPQWSPDGEQIVYTAEEDVTGLAVVDLSGRTRALRTLDNDDWSPDWSPDGRWIAFTSNAESRKSEIYVMPAAGGRPTRLTSNQVAEFDPVWSPDGEHILFASGRAGLWEVYVMRADGTEQRRVTRIGTEYACCGDWQPGT